MAAFACVAVLALAACGSSSDDDGSSTGAASGAGADSGSTSGSSDPSNKSIVVFTPATSNNYVAMWTAAAKDTLERAGYEPRFYENNFDQSEEDQQVQQVIASGDRPAGFIWWPSDNPAGIASVRRLSQIAPVVQTNNKVLPEAQRYVKAFGGVNDYADGVATGRLALRMRDAFRAAGLRFHSPEGNALIVTYVPGYQAGIDRVRGIEDATRDDPFNVVGTVVTRFTSEESYRDVSQALPGLKDRGIDFVIAVSEFPAIGAIKALRESGLTPGRDVGVVTGNCQTNFDLINSGAEYGTILQSPSIEGQTAAQVLAKVLENGGRTTGTDTEYTLPADPDTVPELPAELAYYNYMPLPAIEAGKSPAENKRIVAESRLWGQTADELCAR
ncbi:sugar ABC transporter substrate-binding protein [Conexibacter sp. CPCC 206217]|uniref:sugar ABC transporter substrate-binding protein n=1 Tax=Conexibacter sp. CPCC 206217 TaxID=3064574 RepID=UPI00271B0ECB|nr:sugar ABC transporter substrate-binding protein [Conexibacter sp. CPCC 206217]MDO8212594.1 sugar ABC transporter substrate-binding protein [Conexibacter sp. CPCC 206217]